MPGTICEAYVQVTAEEYALVIENSRPIATVNVSHEIIHRVREDRLVLQNSGQVGVASCFLSLTGCEVNVDEAD